MAVKTSRNCVQGKQSAAKDGGAALKGPHKLTCSTLQHKDSSLKNTRDIRGGSKFTNFRARARTAGITATLSRYGSAARLHCSFVELTPNPACLLQVGTKSVYSINLANNVDPTLVIRDAAPPNSQGWPEPLLLAPPHKQLASACATDSQRSTNLTQAAAGLSMHGSSCQVASNPAQTTTDFGLHRSPFQEAPDQPTCGQLPMTTGLQSTSSITDNTQRGPQLIPEPPPPHPH